MSICFFVYKFLSAYYITVDQFSLSIILESANNVLVRGGVNGMEICIYVHIHKYINMNVHICLYINVYIVLKPLLKQ